MGNVSSDDQCLLLGDNTSDRNKDLLLFESLSCGKGTRAMRARLLDLWQIRPVTAVVPRIFIAHVQHSCQWCMMFKDESTVTTIPIEMPEKVVSSGDEFIRTLYPLSVTKVLSTNIVLHDTTCLAEVDACREKLDRVSRYRVVQLAYLLSLPRDLQSYIARFVFRVKHGYKWSIGTPE